MTNLRKAALAASVALCTSTCAHAVDIYPYEDYADSIHIEGNIVEGDAAFLKRVLDERHSKGQETSFITLDSSGGLLQEAHDMAVMIRGAGITTIVGGDDECASACMLAFAAGTHRIAWQGASLGVHSANNGSADEDGRPREFDPATVMLARDMADFGTPAAVIAKLVLTPPDDMAWLDDKDVQGWVEIMYPDKPAEPKHEQPQTTGNQWTMTCTSTATGNQYTVVWNDYGLTVKGKPFAIREWHAATKEAGAYVVNGPTKFGKYAAIFAGPNPRMVFVNTKGETAQDRCWG